MSSMQEKGIQTLGGFGLTALQAKVYLSIVKREKTTIKNIAKISKVARQDTYRVLNDLHKLGLVEKIIATPTEYKATPLKEAIAILAERRYKENKVLEQEATELISQFNQDSFDTDIGENDSKFVIINEMQARMLEIKKAMDRTQKAVRVVTRWSFFMTYTSELTEEIEQALKRGVELKFVTQKPENAETLPKAVQDLTKNPLFRIKYVRDLPSSIVGIFDNNEVNISLSSKTRPTESAFLWSNNPSLVELAQNYFEIMWTTTTKNQRRAQRKSTRCLEKTITS